jgi:hypothetical protein
VSAVTSGSVYTGTLTVVDSETTDVQTVQLTSNLNWTSIVPFYAQQVGTYNPVAQSLSGGVYSGMGGGYTFYDYSFTAIGMSDFQSSGACMTKSGYTCLISLSFSPMATGIRYAVATAIDGQVYLFKGTGIGTTTDTFSLTPGAYNFGTVSLGSSATTTTTVTNLWTGTVTLNSAPTFTLGALNNGDFQASTSCASIQGGYAQSCSITVTFTPTATGLRQTMMTLTDGAGTTQSVLFQGTAQ